MVMMALNPSRPKGVTTPLNGNFDEWLSIGREISLSHRDSTRRRIVFVSPKNPENDFRPSCTIPAATQLAEQVVYRKSTIC